MAEDELEKDINEIHARLVALKERISAFERQSEATIRADRSQMLDNLRDSVESVSRTQLFLDTGRSMMVNHIDIPGSWVDDRPRGDAVVLHSADMRQQFSELRATSEAALEHVEVIKEQCDEFDVGLDRLTSDLSAVTVRAKDAIARAQRTLEEKQTEVQQTRSAIALRQSEVERLTGEIAKQLKVREDMRIVGANFDARLTEPRARARLTEA
jgi:chromosome segregation ATPase